jgi:hypothetical protein
MRPEAGDTEILIARTVTVVVFDFVESLAAVAVMVTAKLLTGGVEGAV